uniref:Uncharacterized protein n=1 Tax=viral metagenome TaxID=1070528 RepID=A0A6C0ED53_9ZZZZ
MTEKDKIPEKGNMTEEDNNEIFWQLLDYFYDENRYKFNDKSKTDEQNNEEFMKYCNDTYPLLKHLNVFRMYCTKFVCLDLVKYANETQKKYVGWLEHTVYCSPDDDDEEGIALEKQSEDNLRKFYDENRKLTKT